MEPTGIFLWAVDMVIGVLSPVALCGSHEVVFAPRFALRPRIVRFQEPMLVEAFDTSMGIEALDEGVIGGLA